MNHSLATRLLWSSSSCVPSQQPRLVNQATTASRSCREGLTKREPFLVQSPTRPTLLLLLLLLPDANANSSSTTTNTTTAIDSSEGTMGQNWKKCTNSDFSIIGPPTHSVSYDLDNCSYFKRHDGIRINKQVVGYSIQSFEISFLYFIIIVVVFWRWWHNWKKIKIIVPKISKLWRECI